MFKLKRAYDEAGPEDGARFLIDRLWPRGVTKSALQLDGWLKDVAPSNALRRWFNHDPRRWDEFRQRYFSELDSQPDAQREQLATLVEAVRKGPVTLVYGARDEEHNNAVALAEYLKDRKRRR
jgi:uncharacterized protein YeaO (DUF488 family)